MPMLQLLHKGNGLTKPIILVKICYKLSFIQGIAKYLKFNFEKPMQAHNFSLQSDTTILYVYLKAFANHMKGAKL